MQATGINVLSMEVDSSRGFSCDGENYFAVKIYEGIYVYKNACPHIGIPLEWQEDKFLDDSNTLIQCANHGALFKIEDGYCIAGPCSGKKLTAVKFEIRDDEIFLTP